MKKIGLIGGAGPMAGALLFEFIILECQKQFGCKDDKDFPYITLESYPFSPMILIESSQKNRNMIANEVQQAIDTLKYCESEIIGIACNTLHTFLTEINFKDMLFVNMICETIAYVRQQKLKSLLVLGTPTTVESKIYEQDQVEIFYPSPNDQEKITKIIERILEGNINKRDAKIIKSIICKNSNTCINVVLGCTELSLLNNFFEIAYNVIDPLKILAKKIVEKSFKKERN